MLMLETNAYNQTYKIPLKKKKKSSLYCVSVLKLYVLEEETTSQPGPLAICVCCTFKCKPKCLQRGSGSI